MNFPWKAVGVLASALVGYGGGRWHERAATIWPWRAGSQSGAVLATVGGRALTESDVRAALALMPVYQRQHLLHTENRKQLVEELVRRELFAREALERRLDRDGEVIAAAKHVLATRLSKLEVSEDAVRQRITDDQLRKYYEELRQDYVKPERVRFAHMFFAKGGDGVTKRKAADEALAELRQKKDDPYAFGQLARSRSEEAQSRGSDGDLGFFSREELAARFSAAFADAAWALRPIGSISEIIETPAGFHIVKSLSIEPAVAVSFAEAKDRLRDRVAPQEAALATVGLVAELGARYGVTVNDAAIAAARLEDAPPP